MVGVIRRILQHKKYTGWHSHYTPPASDPCMTPPPLDTSKNPRGPLWVVSLISLDAPCAFGMRVYYFCHPPPHRERSMLMVGIPLEYQRYSKHPRRPPLRLYLWTPPSEIYVDGWGSPWNTRGNDESAFYRYISS